MVQVFRRDKNDQPATNLILRGLNPASQYQITDADAGKLQVVSGKTLMETGLHVEIPDARGASLLFYQKIQ